MALLLVPACVLDTKVGGNPGATVGDDSSSGPGATETGTSDSGEPSTGGPEPGESTTDESTTDESTTDESTTGEPLIPECGCIVDEPWTEGIHTPSLPTCGELLCDVVTGEVGFDGLVVDNPEALDCVLTVLRDRTPGLVRWATTENGDQFTDDGYALIHPNGTVVRRDWGNKDLSYGVTDATVGALPEPAVFEDCLLQSTDSERFHCAAHFDVGPPALICDSGWGASLI